MERARALAPRVLRTTLVALLVLGPGACTLPGAGPREPGPTPPPLRTSTPSPSADGALPSPDDLRAAARDTGAGLLVTAAEGVTPIDPAPTDHGATLLTWTTGGRPGADAGAVTVAHLVAPAGWTLDLTADGSVVAYDEDGVAVAGAAPPRVEAADGSPRPRLVPETVADDLITLTLRGPTGADAEADAVLGEVEVSLEVSTGALASADWGVREGGRSLAVVPTDWARDAGEAGTALLWAQLRAAEPEADSAVMHDQLVCHSIGAPEKAAWNLEPWRPDVGLLAVLAAACNPT